MDISIWFQNNFIEIFGAITGIIYVFLEIRQNLWLWPVGIITSAVYIWVFFTSKFYADMSLQVYYLAVSILGWIWWKKGSNGAAGNNEAGQKHELKVNRLDKIRGIILVIVFFILYFLLWLILSKLTDSPVPVWDAFITSLSIVATWMLAKKIYEHWYLWIVVNSMSAFVFILRGLYPTVVLYVVYCIMSFAGLIEWRKDLEGKNDNHR
jgi:nicotinamide mononucleotide transporter